ncbi:hypothetical protein [Saccharopolyspora hattusasensis]|uniref:hypothetical protein n=1 Tax=Saccharopolyspora hattusasensis TaxID=1128679 RepID=UPI003D95542C
MTDRTYRIPMSGVTGRMGYRLAQALSMKCGIGHRGPSPSYQASATTAVKH